MRCLDIRSAGALLAMALAGCASVAPESAVPEAMERYEIPGVDAAVGPSRAWWEDFGDVGLDALVALCMQENHDLKSAVAAVLEARALAGAQRRDGLPLGGLEAGVESARPSTLEANPYDPAGPRAPSHDVARIGQSLSWEIDLFGRIGTTTAVAERQADAAFADAHAAAALLQVEAVRQYIALRQAQADLESTGIEADATGRLARRMEVRAEAGLADRREALAAAASHARVEGERARAQASAAAAAAALAVLAGRSPFDRDFDWDALMAPAGLPDPPREIAIERPGDLLARRPDVARADAHLRASIGNLVLAERAHLPRLTLDLVAGLNAPFGMLGDVGATRYAAGPSLQWAWLDSGRRRARQAAAAAGSEAAWHRFEHTVLTALGESESAAGQWTAAEADLRRVRQAEAAALRSFDHARARAAAGIESPTTALEQEAVYQQARRDAFAAHAGLLLAHAQLQLALGAWRPEADSLTRAVTR